MYAQVSLDMNTHPNALTLPAAAVGSDSGGNFVYTVTGDRITRVGIKIGLADNGNIEVTAGLADDTPVVATVKSAPPPAHWFSRRWSTRTPRVERSMTSSKWLMRGVALGCRVSRPVAPLPRLPPSKQRRT